MVAEIKSEDKPVVLRPNGKRERRRDKLNHPRPKVRKTYNQKLSQPHFKAVEYYVRGMTKTDALVKAGYAKSTASKCAWQIFGREDVQRAIEERRTVLRVRTHDMIDRVQEELAHIAFFNLGEVLEVTEDGYFLYNFKDTTMEQFAAIGEATVETYMEDGERVKRIKIKPYDKKAALDSLARIYGMFQDNININGQGGELSLEERLARGRNRVKQEAEEVIFDGEFEEITEGGA